MNTILRTQLKAAPSLSFAPKPKLLLQRKCSNNECTESRQKRLALQRSSTNQAEPSEVPPIVHEVLRSSGQPLDTATRGFMEPRLGHDFSRVRVHTDARGAESAWTVNALAYTVGHDVVFGAGQYAPHTIEGQKLIGHELTHMVQQEHAAPTNFQIAPPQDVFEHEANSVANGLSVNAAHIQGALASPMLQRQPAPLKDEQKQKPGEKIATSQPSPQKIPTAGKPEGEKEGIEAGVSAGVETETKKEGGKTKTEVAGKYTIEVTIPITDKARLGPISFLKEVGVEASGGLKSSTGPRSPLTNLEVGAAVKAISVDFKKVEVPLGIADFGISGQALASAEYSPMEEKGAVKFGGGVETEAKFKRSEKSPFFISVKGSVEKTYEKDGSAEFKWSPLTWKTSAAVGVEF